MISFDEPVTINEIVALADRREQVDLSPAVVGAVREVHRESCLLAARIPTYGRTTGVGANRSSLIAADDPDYGMRLLRSHAVDAGDPLPPRSVRAMLAVRLSQLSSPGSGLNPAVLDGLQRMLNDDALPEIRQYASIGTGDLAALAGTALTLIGERPATRPLTPMAPWSADSALPFMSSSALTIGRACLAIDELRRLDYASNLVYILSFIALAGNPSAFSRTAADAAASPKTLEVTEQLRTLLESSVVGQWAPARIQDPYGLRVYPVAQATVAASLSSLAAQVERSMTVAQENPLFDPAAGEVIHHGAFYQASLSLELDGATLALALTAPIAHSRIRMMNDPESNAGRPFLASGAEGSSGLMMVEYVAAGAIAEIRNAAHPASVGTLVLSRGAEEDATFASQAVHQLERSIAAFRILLACELIGTVRLLRHHGLCSTLSGVAADAVAVCALIPDDPTDRDMRGDLAVADSILDELGQLAFGRWQSPSRADAGLG